MSIFVVNLLFVSIVLTRIVATIWLDIANAYGSIPHFLCSSEIRCTCKLEFAPGNWHQHLKGIFAGCTLSVILFLAGIDIILEYTLLTSAPNFNICFYASSSPCPLPLTAILKYSKISRHLLLRDSKDHLLPVIRLILNQVPGT